jgi:hypothetical protein
MRSLRMAEYVLTDEDKNIIAKDMETDKTLLFIANPKNFKFSIGDILNCEELRYDGKTGKDVWKRREAGIGLPHRYKYVFENELGIGYVQRLSVNGGKLVEQPICVTKFDPRLTRFVVDQEYADHLLLAEPGETFDLKWDYKVKRKQREEMNKYNDSIKEKFTTQQEAAQLVSNLTPGTKFWMSTHGRKSPHHLEYEVAGILIDKFYPANTKLSYRVPAYGNSYMYDISVGQLMHHCVWLTKPRFKNEV